MSHNAEPRNGFMRLKPERTRYDASRTAILPVPFERTTSYGQGTSRGPEAIIEASAYLETWDEELGIDPSLAGIATLPACDPRDEDLAAALSEIESAALAPLQEGKFLVTLGGEHTLTSAIARAARRATGRPMGVVQFDAHADLRNRYMGTPYSHACVMRRLVEDDFPTLAIGLRSLSPREAEFAERKSLPILWAHEMARHPSQTESRFLDQLAELPEEIYLTFDIDYFDPALVPATGTVEPGGGSWYPALNLLRLLFQHKKVVAMDLVELAPIPGHPASDFLAAKLIYKCLGYLAQAERFSAAVR